MMELCVLLQIMLCGVELQTVSNSDGSQAVAVTRKQDARVVTETVTVKTPVIAAQTSPLHGSSRKYYLYDGYYYK